MRRIECLENPQPSLFDGEFHALRILVVSLEFIEDLQQRTVDLGPQGRQFPGHFVNILRRAHTGEEILALRVDQVFAPRLRRSGQAIPRKSHADARLVADVADYHRADIHGCSKQAGDPVAAPVLFGRGRSPRLKGRMNGQPQLLKRVLRKGFPDLLKIDFFKVLGEFLELAGRKVGILFRVVLALDLLHRRIEVAMRQAGRRSHDHLAEHGDKAPIAIPSRPVVPGLPDKAGQRLVGKTQIQHGIHESGNRHGGPGSHGDQQRILRIPEFFLHALFEFFQLGFDLFRQTRRILASMLVEISAGFGGYGKPGRHRQAHAGHLGQVGAAHAEYGLHRRVALGVFGARAEEENVLFIRSHFCTPRQ